AVIAKNLLLNQDHFFEVPEPQLPPFSPHSGLPDYLRFEKTSIVFWLGEAKSMTLSLKDKDHKMVWTTPLQGQKGFNEYRWDLIIKREESDLPYFVDYEKFLEPGHYLLILSDGKTDLEQRFVVKNGD
ncbi:MAG: hypothetical protein ACKVU2_16155, partial [Saprospiraceae bacterium]